MKGCVSMSDRMHTGSHDEQIFRRTAVKSKKVNLYPSIRRGGIRL